MAGDHELPTAVRRAWWPALGAFAFGVGLLALALTLDVELQRQVGGAIGPEAYPGLLALLIIVLALVLVVCAARGGAAGTAPEVAGSDELDDAVLVSGAPNRRGVVLTLGLLCLYTLLLPTVGYLLATPPVLVGLMLLTGERRWLLMIIGALVLTGALYLFFRYGMSLVLPEGLLGERLPG